MKRWKVTVDHEVGTGQLNGFHCPYAVYYNGGKIFNWWFYCHSFKTIEEAEKFIKTRQAGQVDEFGKLVMYYD